MIIIIVIMIIFIAVVIYIDLQCQFGSLSTKSYLIGIILIVFWELNTFWPLE